MKYQLRPDQSEFVGKIHAAWNQGAQNVVGVASTGFGKTVVLGYLAEQNGAPACIMAHRQELVGQISMTLAGYGIRHNLIAADATVRSIAAMQVAEYGACYYTPSAPVAVAGVDTLVRRQINEAWAAQVTLAVPDEAHHVLRDNKWGASMALFPKARGFLPTATPKRADNKGLGRHADGLADAMVQAPPMRWLIEQGFLTDYRILCVESDLRLLDSEIAAGGDWSTAALRKASEKSHIVGDVVANYLRFAAGTLGVTFATDVETAQEMTAAYRANGVAAECLTGKTQDAVRRQMLKRFAARQVTQIVAVDIISEGFDLPAIETISMARPTQSLALFMQQFGRGLRPLPGKQRALILDHVGNVVRHGLPDQPRVWSLDRTETRGKNAPTDALPVRVCLQCFEPFERKYRDCPHCGHYHEPASRASPAQVDGDLAEMSPELLAKLRGEMPLPIEDERWRLQQTGLPNTYIMGQVKHHAARLDTLAALRDAMARWGGRWHAIGDTDSMIQRRFFHAFGIDVLSAQTLKRAEAQALLDRIVNSL